MPRTRGTHAGPQGGGKLRQQLRIEFVGFGEPTGGAGKIAYPARTGHDDRQMGGCQLGDQLQLKAAAGFEHD